MLNCAYCNMPCQPTREHVVPRWYNDTPGESETFSARAPFTHIKGDIVVRDVCSVCNGGALSALDSYGKAMYEQYFTSQVYEGDTVDFEYDGNRLIRWLLKLSYNSSRAQNADVTILRAYRDAMLGKVPIPPQIRCWLHLVPSTSFDDETRVVRAARKSEQGQPNVTMPRWFRICQLRLTDHPAIALVQRAVLINSFAFSLVLTRPDAPWPSPDFDQWGEAFEKGYPAAQTISPGEGRLMVSTGWDHSAVSISSTFTHYPSRFLETPNPFVEGVHKGHLNVLMLHIPHEMIERGESDPIAQILRDMVSSCEKGMTFRQRLGIMVDGFDADPRALWQIPHVRMFFRHLFEQCPFVMFLSHPDGGLLKVFAACWIYEEGMTEEIEGQRLSDFLQRAFIGINGLNHTIMLSEEQNREICMSAAKVLIGDP